MSRLPWRQALPWPTCRVLPSQRGGFLLGPRPALQRESRVGELSQAPCRSAIIRATSVHVVQDERGWAPSFQSAPAHGRPHQIRSHRQTGEAAPLPPSCSARVGNTRRDPGHLLRLPDLTSRRCRNAASRCEREKEGGSEGEMKGAVAPGDYVYFKSIVPLHKISVSSRAPRLPPSHVLSH